MLLNLPEYQVFEQIYASSNSQVYRGIREHDNLPVILKILTTEFPSTQTIGQYKLEYEVTKSLISDFVINVYDFIQYQNKFVIVLEDIIDTGKTMNEFLPQLHHQHPASLKIAALLHKPEATAYPITIDYLGFSVPNKFLLGYGLDYDGLGRNLKEIYQLTDTPS